MSSQHPVIGLYSFLFLLLLGSCVCDFCVTSWSPAEFVYQGTRRMCNISDMGFPVVVPVPALYYNSSLSELYISERKYDLKNMTAAAVAYFIQTNDPYAVQNTTFNSTSVPGVTWNTTYSQTTGSCSKIACPSDLNVDALQPKYYGLCGGCNQVIHALCSQDNGFFSLCPAGQYCLQPRYAFNCTKNPCQAQAAGCFDGYLTYGDCMSKTNASDCTAIPGPASVGLHPPVCDGWTNPRYCPVAPYSNDPIYCAVSSVPSRECLQYVAQGIPVRGDTLFCSYFPCSNNSPCECSFKDITFRSVLLGTNITLTTGKLNLIKVKEKLPPVPSEVFCVPTQIFHDKKSFSVRKVGEQPAVVQWYSELYSGASLCYDQLCKETIPLEFQGVTHKLCVTVTCGENSIRQCFVFLGIEKCDKYIDSIEELFDTECLTSSQEAALVITMIASCLIILGFLIALLVMLVALVAYAKRCREYKRSLETANGELQEAKGRSQFMEDMSGFFERARRYFSGPVRTASNTVILFSLLFVLGSACDVTTVQLVSSSSMGTTQVAGKTAMVFKEIGECTTLVGLDGVSLAKISLISQDVRHSYDLSYYTTSYNIKTEDRTRCRTEGNCMESNCATLAGTGVPVDAWGSLSDPQGLIMPGKTTCFQVCQGLGLIRDGTECGCLYVTPNCRYSRWWFEPVGPGFSVWQHASKRVHNTFLVEFFNGTTLNFEDSYESPWVSATSTTLSTGSYFVDISDKCLVVSLSNSNSFLGACSTLLSPQAGKVGDVQVLNVEWFSNPNAQSFVYDQNIIESWSSSASETSIKYKTAAMGQDLPSIDLPYEDDFLIIKNTSKGFGLSESRKASVDQVTLVLDTLAFSIIDEQSKSCPEICELGTAYGCSNCPTPYSLVIRARSSCGTGNSKVKIEGCEFITPTSVYLSDSCSEFVLSCYGYQGGDLKVILSGNTETDGKTQVQVTELTYSSDNRTVIAAGIDEEHATDRTRWSPFNWLINIINGFGTWLDYFLLIFWAVVLVVLTFVMAYLGLVLYKKFKSTPVSYKKLETEMPNMIRNQDVEMIETPSSAAQNGMAPTGYVVINNRKIPTY